MTSTTDKPWSDERCNTLISHHAPDTDTEQQILDARSLIRAAVAEASNEEAAEVMRLQTELAEARAAVVEARAEERANGIPGWAFTDCLDSAVKNPGWPIHVHTDNAATADVSAVDDSMEPVRVVRIRARKGGGP